jgi:regulator of sirC expression with transglutaminase-like and TPR domain
MLTQHHKSNQIAERAEQLYASGFNALAENKTEAAQRCFGLMLALSPLDERPWAGLGAAREQLEDFHVAAGLYKLGSSVAPKSIYCKLGEARSRARLGEHHAALQLLDQAELLAEDSRALAAIEEIRGDL